LANAFIEEVLDEKTNITFPDIYETYLAPGERAIPLNVAEESFTLQSIMLIKEEIEGIVDPGSQMIVQGCVP
jgi:hypothetical protein